jgi:predicted phosphodiesterase
MRIAILSDIHGNSVALDAVLADAQAAGADAWWVVGDLAMMGPDPVGSLERLNALPNALFVRGNTDRYVCNPIDLSDIDAAAQTHGAAAIAERVAVQAWTQGVLLTSGWLSWLSTLGVEQRAALPDGTQALIVHASPGTDDGRGIRPVMSDGEIATAIEGCDANLVFVGHTHWQLERTVGGVHIVNQGSVSMPFSADTRASYYLLHADQTGHALEHRRVSYDTGEVLDHARRIHFPGIGILGRALRGELRPAWMTA